MSSLRRYTHEAIQEWYALCKENKDVQIVMAKYLRS
jgi:hypothetical protein